MGTIHEGIHHIVLRSDAEDLLSSSDVNDVEYDDDSSSLSSNIANIKAISPDMITISKSCSKYNVSEPQ